MNTLGALRRVLIAGVATSSAACTSTPSEMRVAGPPTRFETSQSYEAFVGCIAERVVTKFKMTSFPTARGTSFVYDFGSVGVAKAGMLVDVMRGPPVAAEVSIKGGPWLGRDKLLLNAVRGCAVS
jgi:hypothetical protein